MPLTPAAAAPGYPDGNSAGPLDALVRIVGRWAGEVTSNAAARSPAPALPPGLDRLLPPRWQDLPASNLSASGSPIQLSVDTARPNELRAAIELSCGMAALATCFPENGAQMIGQLDGLVGPRVPRLGIGLRLGGPRTSWKVYIGSDQPADFIPWIRSFRRHGLLCNDDSPPSMRLCRHIAAASVLRGCSFAADAAGTLVASSLYYRSLSPYQPRHATETFRLADAGNAAPAAVALAEALGFAPGTGKGCFGYTIGIGANGDVDHLKIEFGQIPWCESHALALPPLHHLGIQGLSAAEALCRTITAVCRPDEPVGPEVVSWRGGSSSAGSLVAYVPVAPGSRTSAAH